MGADLVHREHDGEPEGQGQPDDHPSRSGRIRAVGGGGGGRGCGERTKDGVTGVRGGSGGGSGVTRARILTSVRLLQEGHSLRDDDGQRCPAQEPGPQDAHQLEAFLFWGGSRDHVIT